MSPSPSRSGVSRGLLMAIGGAEDKVNDRAVLSRFVQEAGGPNARIAIFPTGSQLADTGQRYANLFLDLEADEAHVIEIRDREDALQHAQAISGLLEDMTGVFFAGGNQLRLSTVLGGTDIVRTLRRRHAAGAVVAGTSAGASLLSEHMIAFGQSGPALNHAMVTLVPGLGLTNRVVVDQHFRERDRLGRLLTALTYNPFMIGLGVDENTAALIDAANRVHVIGTGAVTVADAAASSWTNADRIIHLQAPLAILGISVHILTPGCTFDLDQRRAFPPGSAAGEGITP